MNTNSIQIFLNSKTASKYNNGFTSDCTFYLPPIEIPRKSRCYLSIQSCSIPYSFCNCDYYNNVLSYSLNGTDHVINIEQGNYTVLTLAKYLLDATGLTFTYNSTKNRYVITHPTYNFVLKSDSTCFELLGFPDNNNYSSASKSLTSIITINLFPIRAVLIESSNIICNNINAYENQQNNASILASIPVNTSPNSIITYSNNGYTKFLVDHFDNFTNLNIRLTDQDGDTLDLNGCHWSMAIQIDFN